MRSPRNATFSIRRLRTSMTSSSLRTVSPDSNSRRGISPNGSTASAASSIVEFVIERRAHSAIDVQAEEEQRQFSNEIGIFEERPTFQRGVGSEVPGIFEVLEGQYQSL